MFVLSLILSRSGHLFKIELHGCRGRNVRQGSHQTEQRTPISVATMVSPGETLTVLHDSKVEQVVVEVSIGNVERARRHSGASSPLVGTNSAVSAFHCDREVKPHSQLF
jgi:hypothetical protein